MTATKKSVRPPGGNREIRAIKGLDNYRTGDLLTRTTLFLVILLGFAFILAPATTADSYVGGIPLTTVREGMVSGGLFIDGYPGLSTPAEQSFVLPAYSDIQWARLYVDVYCGNQQNNYPVIATVSFNGGDGYRTLAVEDLNVPYSFHGEGGSGPVQVNDHCTRVTSDYLMWYDVRDLIIGKNVGARVTTAKPPAYNGTYDGRIKTITLVVAYDDGDDDRVYYWVNAGHDVDSYQSEEAGDPYTGETEFSTGSLVGDWDTATLNSIHLASTDGEYAFNNEDLDSGKPLGPYFGIDTWDVSSEIRPGKDSLLTYKRTPDAAGTTGGYFKIILSTLEARYPGSGVSGGGSGGGSSTGEIGQWGTRVEIDSFPDEAVIYIDDIEIDATTNSTRYDISPGRHAFRVGKEGYQSPQNQVVDVVSGKQTVVSFTLIPSSAELFISSIPHGAGVWIDGEEIGGITPITIQNLEEGQHSVLLSLEGYDNFRSPVTLLSGERTKMEVTLAPSGSTLLNGDGSSSRTAGTSLETGYQGGRLIPALTGRVNGNVSLATVSDYSGLIIPGESHQYPLRITIPDDGAVQAARIYVYTTWSHDETRREGTYSRLNAVLDGYTLPLEAVYTDRKGSGPYDYPVETFAYDATSKVKSSGEYTLEVTSTCTGSNVTAVYGAAAVVIYARASDPEIRYWVTEGADIVFSNVGFGLADDEAKTTSLFDGEIDLTQVSAARLTVISTAASGLGEERNTVGLNGKDQVNLLDGGASVISVADIDVLPVLKSSGNTGAVGSMSGSGQKGDYLENRGMILVVGSGPVKEYTSSGNLQSASDIPLHIRLTAVTGDIERKVIRWALYLAGMVSTLDEEKECECNVPVIAPLTADPSPASPATATGPISTATRAGLVVTTTSMSPGPVSGNSGGTGKPALGGAYITSYPGEADIYIDGRQTVFKTPFVAYGLKEGFHTITLKREKDTLSSQVYIPADALIPVAFSMEPAVRREICLNLADFTGDPVTFGGLAPPASPGEFVEMANGDTFLTVLHNGSYISFVVPGVLQSGGRYSLKSDPSVGYPAIEVISSTPGARVMVDGFDTGEVTPVILRNVSSGVHRIGVQMAGCLPAEETNNYVDTSKGIDYTLKFSPEPYAWGTLTVVSDPPDAKIAIYGKNSGLTTPASIPYLAMGYYEVQVTDGEITRARDVILEPGKNITVSFNLYED
jgi:hypothetical protein